MTCLELIVRATGRFLEDMGWLGVAVGTGISYLWKPKDTFRWPVVDGQIPVDIVEGLRLLAAVLRAGHNDTGGNDETPCRLQVTLSPPTAKLDDTTYPITPNGADFLRELIDAGGEWINVSGLEIRLTREKENLPQPIVALIESKRGAGTRLIREKAWLNKAKSCQ